jgi:flavin reductase (DIM6/NTAB) family NADH-FMN oxidoreductase RutF
MQIDNKALFNIGYGLYVVTTNDGVKDNGLIVNTVTQLTSTPLVIGVTVCKENYSYSVIKNSGKLNVNCLTKETPFSVFEKYGFQSGKTVDKFIGESVKRSSNGLAIIPDYVNAVISLEVKETIDLGTHGLFICEVVEAEVLSDKESITYSYYHKNVKPTPKSTNKGYVCKICGYVYQGENLPADFVCPICKHGVVDFEKII